VTTTHLLDALTIRSWFTHLGKHEIGLRVYSLPDRPASWAGVDEKIAASLQVR
jgi:hypothetical protein